MASSKYKVRNFAREDERTLEIAVTDATVESDSAHFVLAVSNLRKSFVDPTGGRLEVLRDVTFTSSAGEMLAIIGASGAGKSTLLHILGGLDAADSGRVRLGELDITRETGSDLAHFRQHNVGFVFQSHRLLPDLSTEENVALPLMVARVNPGQARHRARQILTSVGLENRWSHAAGELSGGEQQRAALARALVNHPRLVLADEPTGNLDTQNGLEVSELLFRLCRESNACVIVATHNERLARSCDRVLVLTEGRIIEDSGRFHQ